MTNFHLSKKPCQVRCAATCCTITPRNWFFLWRNNFHHRTIFAFVTHHKNITKRPDPRVSVRAGRWHGTPLMPLGTVLEACFAGRRIHGELGKSHVPKFRSHQVRPRVVFQLAHVSLSCLNTCLIQVLTRVIFLLVHTSCLPLGHMSPPGYMASSSISTWHVRIPPYVPS